MGRKKKAVCNMDCFNCIHPDCIYDGDASSKESQEAKKRDAEVHKKAKECAGAATYYERNREKILEKHKVYRATHKEEIKARRKGEYQRNREQRLQYQREYYQANKERRDKYNAEYRAKNRERINA